MTADLHPELRKALEVEMVRWLMEYHDPGSAARNAIDALLAVEVEVPCMPTFNGRGWDTTRTLSLREVSK